MTDPKALVGRRSDRYDLSPSPYRLRAVAGNVMRLREDVRKTVAFIGFGSLQNFDPKGTIFFVSYKKLTYLVTAQHVAYKIGDAPFSFRMNRRDGSYITMTHDPDEDGPQFPWFFPEADPPIDIAVMPWNVDPEKENLDMLFMPPEMWHADGIPEREIGVGDFCYAVGLFWVTAGRRQNTPVVHTGHIALMPGGEGVPMRDWRDRNAPSIMARSYLVELANLPGLSGAPVFVRPTLGRLDLGDDAGSDQFDREAILPRLGVRLLGIWASSWDGREIQFQEDGRRDVRVPVGMGVVTPVQRLIDLLDSGPVAQHRAEKIRQMEARAAAKPD